MNDEVKNILKYLDEKLKKKGTSLKKMYKKANKKDRFDLRLQKIADLLGIKIVVKNDLTDENGRIISGKSDCEKKIIYINGSNIGERMRFTFGHELYIMYCVI